MNTAVAEAATLGVPQATPSLRSNFKWTFTGNVVYAACQWGMLSVLAKVGNTAIVGQFALGLAIAAPVFMFSNLHLRAVQATDARSEYEFADYFTLRVLASALGLAVVAALAWRLHYDATTRWVVLLVAASKAVESLSDVVAGLLQKHERLDQVAISLMIRGGLSLAAFGTTFLRTRSLMAAVAALVITWSAVFVVYDLWRAQGVMIAPRQYFRVDAATLRRLLVVSAPLGVVMTLISLNINGPRYLLVKYLGEAELGMFASMAYLLVAVSLIVNALGQSASARLARMFAARDFAGFRGTLRKLLTMAAVVPVVGVPVAMLFGRQLLTLLYRVEYGRQVNVLVIMVVTAGLTAVGSFLGYGMTAARSFRAQMPVIGATCLTTYVLCLLLIPRMGLVGAAWALLASETVFAASGALCLRYSLRKARA
jgi:O-antigen/teichoic acid export membrane protein